MYSKNAENRKSIFVFLVYLLDRNHFPIHFSWYRPGMFQVREPFSSVHFFFKKFSSTSSSFEKTKSKFNFFKEIFLVKFSSKFLSELEVKLYFPPNLHFWCYSMSAASFWIHLSSCNLHIVISSRLDYVINEKNSKKRTWIEYRSETLNYVNLNSVEVHLGNGGWAQVCS